VEPEFGDELLQLAQRNVVAHASSQPPRRPDQNPVDRSAEHGLVGAEVGSELALEQIAARVLRPAARAEWRTPTSTPPLDTANGTALVIWLTVERSAQARSFTARLAHQVVGASRYAALCRKEVSGLGPESAGAESTVRTVDGCRGLVNVQPARPQTGQSVARASSDRAGRRELHHHLAYGGAR
jgi:hypothetical protein